MTPRPAEWSEHVLSDALMRVHIETLFTHDAGGRMIRVNEPEGKPAPRFFLGRTDRGFERRFRHDVSEDLVQALEQACARDADGDEALGPRDSTEYERLLARDAPVENVWAGPAHRFPAALPAASDAVLVTSENIELLRPHFAAWFDHVALRQPFLALVKHGEAVSVCCSVRMTPFAHEAGVETHGEFRGRGYAAQAVSAWASAVRTIGRVPLYSTSWQNTASQAVAAKLGLVCYGADLHIR